MDLSTIQQKLNNKSYKSRQTFCDDLELIVKNCLTYNGDDTCESQFIFIFINFEFKSLSGSIFLSLR